MPSKVQVKFNKNRETKGTVVFAEDGDPSDHKVGSLYLKKAAASDLGNPETLAVTIEAK